MFSEARISLKTLHAQLDWVIASERDRGKIGEQKGRLGLKINPVC